MNEGITINAKHSYNDFDLYINERTIGQPQKRSMRQSIPFMNGFYDFTKINGELSWEQRELTYVFDIVGDTIEDMDVLRDQINDWLLNAHDIDIFDDTIQGYHFHGSLDTSKVKEEGEKVELEVTFICYPFKIANSLTEQILSAGTYTINISGQSVKPTAVATECMTVQIGDAIISVDTTEIELSELLKRGDNTVIVTGTGTVTLSWRNEVM